MSEYRIKIEEKNNGEVRYIPQVGTPQLRIGKFDFLSLSWENIIQREFSGTYGYFTAKTITESHDKEENALLIIEKFKKYLLIEEGKNMKSITYKTIK